MKLAWSAAATAAQKRRKLLHSRPAPSFREDAALAADSEAAVRSGGIPSVAEDATSGSEGPGGLPSTADSNAVGFSNDLRMSRSLQDEGNKLAQAGQFSAALEKWASALAHTPRSASLHESRAQVLLERGEAWEAMQAASRATELEHEWSEAWLTLARAQLNLGEPALASQSASRALQLQPADSEAQSALAAANQLVAKQREVMRQHAADVGRLESRGMAVVRQTVNPRVRVVDRGSPGGAPLPLPGFLEVHAPSPEVRPADQSGSGRSSQEGEEEEYGSEGGAVFRPAAIPPSSASSSQPLPERHEKGCGSAAAGGLANSVSVAPGEVTGQELGLSAGRWPDIEPGIDTTGCGSAAAAGGSVAVSCEREDVGGQEQGFSVRVRVAGSSSLRTEEEEDG